MRYLPTIQTDDPHNLTGLQPGQWLNYGGAIGRYMGQRNGCQWIAWSDTARRRFADFAAAFNA